MSSAPPPDADRPAKPAAAADKNAVIRKLTGTEESPQQRLLKKHIPAWVISGAVHVALITTLIVVDKLFAKPPKPPASDDQITVVADDKDQDTKQPDLTNPDLGFDPDIPAAVQNDNLQDVNVDTKTVTQEPPGVESVNTVKQDVIPPAGVGSTDSLNPGNVGDAGNVMKGEGAGGTGLIANAGFNGRSAATKSRLVAAGGGNAASEAAVARGLIWLAKQQKANGSWVYDGSSANDTIAATGMALLPFLAAGQTHKVSKDNKYNKNVGAGIAFLVGNQQPNGSFKGSSGMYSHAIATVALCEALGMSGDRAALQQPAQKAVNYILNAQGPNGSWGYGPGTNGDTSIVGWQIQALQSAKLCKELVVDKRAYEKARKFLDSVASGSNKSQYGYSSPGATPTLTAVGLLSRYYVDGWGPNQPGMAAGVNYLLKSWTPTEAKMDMYYYYYATQVLHFYEGPEWHKDWNPAMRDLLVKIQVPDARGANGGSWDPDGVWFGPHCGRLGQTCMSLLTLEVYYRHLPLYKRDNAGLKELERVK